MSEISASLVWGVTWLSNFCQGFTVECYVKRKTIQKTVTNKIIVSSFFASLLMILPPLLIPLLPPPPSLHSPQIAVRLWRCDIGLG